MSFFLIAVRNILRNRTRAISTILIIAVGLAALLIGSGFMLSTYDSLQEIAKRVEGHVIVLKDESVPAQGGVDQQLTLPNWQAIQDELWDDDRVLRILPRARFEGLIRHGHNSAAFFGTGVDPKEEFRVYGPFLKTTAVLDPWLSDQDMPDVVLGTQLAETLSATAGDELTLHTLRSDGQSTEVMVRLAGLFHTGTPELDDHTLMVNLSTVSRLLGSEKISQLSIYLEHYEDAAAIKQLLQAKLEGVLVQTWDQRAELYDKVKAQYDRIFGVMGIIILVVVFLAISNTIALAMYQRRDEIATLGALGTPSTRVYANFILEACLIGVVATSLGMLIAYATANAINLASLMMPAPPGRSEGYPIYIYISWPHYLVTSVVLIAIVAFASFIATYNNAKVNIAKALS
ncbi:MAG: ABC transporter permease [Gammaproteobacteria bacterium]|nr:ABC transporter permease [Gammaproteobacteria bacterium]